MLRKDVLEKRLQIAGMVLILGLLAEGFCLLGRGPIAFLLFVGLAGLLLPLGMLIFLFALVRTGHSKSHSAE